MSDPETKHSIYRGIRRIAREAVIFTLLGPFAFVGAYLAVQAHNAPSLAPYVVVKSCPSPPGSWQSQKGDVFDQAEPTTFPCDVIHVSGFIPDAKFDDGTGLPWFDEKDGFYIQDHSEYGSRWLKFAPNVSSNRVTRTLNRVSLSAYVHPFEAVEVALVFGWPLGLSVWFAYRIIRFAVQG